MTQKYKKKPLIIEAVQWTGSNLDEVKTFLGDSFIEHRAERHIGGKSDIIISTLEGSYITPKGYYFIKGIEGELYPCDSNIFIKTYDLEV